MASKTKIYLALVATGFAALVVDRCYFGASAPASTAANEVDPDTEGEVAESKPAPHSRPVPPQAGQLKRSVPKLHFPRNLPAYDPVIEMRDIFARSDPDHSIPDTGHPGRGGSAKKEAATDAIGRDDFQTTHRIDAVMVQESLRIAVVDGRWMRVGDAVDTCTLIRIEGDSAVFQCHDGDTVLSPSGKRRHPPG
jgi:hypothetical protein